MSPNYMPLRSLVVPPFDGAEWSDVVACGGCYKADGMEMTMAEYKLAAETALGFVSLQFKEISY
jgi:hypothetical protein